jgi:thiamine-phosphate pyrophosphorylase
MNDAYYQIIDANINRVAEGLRVIEDYTRFISKQKSVTEQLAQIRKKINESEDHPIEHLLIRDTTQDMRAAELPRARKDTFNLLKANFKRVEEALRVLEEYTGNTSYNRIRYSMYGLEKEIILGTVIQLRDKVSSKQEVLEKARLIQPKAKKAGIPFIVNDYLDVALLSNADGLHTGQDDLDISHIRKLLGPHKIIGRSSSTLKEGIQAQKDGADYIGIGPIFATPTKNDRSAIGFEYLKNAKKDITIPYVAIGGVNLETMAKIAPYDPPLVALVRAYPDIPKINAKYFPT